MTDTVYVQICSRMWRPLPRILYFMVYSVTPHPPLSHHAPSLCVAVLYTGCESLYKMSQLDERPEVYRC